MPHTVFHVKLWRFYEACCVCCVRFGCEPLRSADFVPSVGAAVRSFIDEVNNRESAMCAHPEDYVLFHLADYDDETGEFSPTERGIVSLARGKDVQRDAKENA